jgi:RNA polymerase sigma factor (sigma-70 family)
MPSASPTARRVVSDYFQEVGTHPIPTPAEEAALFRSYVQAVDDRERTKLRHRIACGYLKFVIKRARSRTKNEELLQELIAEGNIGLLVAINKFDVERGNRFLTYAAPWIDVYMREFLNKNSTVHIPNHARKKYRVIRKEEDKLMAQGVISQPTVAEPTMCSTDPALLPSSSNVEEIVRERRTQILPYLFAAKLNRREVFILVQHFGLRGDTECRTFREIAVIMYRIDGSFVNSEQIKQSVESSLAKLKQHLAGLQISTTSDVL